MGRYLEYVDNYTKKVFQNEQNLSDFFWYHAVLWLWISDFDAKLKLQFHIISSYNNSINYVYKCIYKSCFAWIKNIAQIISVSQMLKIPNETLLRHSKINYIVVSYFFCKRIQYSIHYLHLM